MKQVFSKIQPVVNQPLMLDEASAHHIFDVLRTSDKETIRVVCDEQVYLAHPSDKPYVFVFGKEEVQPRLVHVTLCAALIKGDRFEWMLQKAAELGVSRIVPFTSARTIISLDEKKALRKLERWSAILESACKQSNRADYVVLEPVTSIMALPAYKSRCNLIAYEKEDCTRHLANYLQSFPDSITVVIGPEGGFTREEVDYLVENGFMPCSLGNQILRAETAVCFVLSAVEYQTHCKKEEAEA